MITVDVRTSEKSDATLSPKRRKIFHRVLSSDTRDHEDGEEPNTLLLKGIKCASKAALFAKLDPAELPHLVLAFISRTYSKGEELIKQGEMCEEFFIVQSGSAAVMITRPGAEEPRQDIVIRNGGCFEVRAMLLDEPVRGTLVALEELNVWVLRKEDFDRLGLKEKLNNLSLPKLAAVHDGGCSMDAIPKEDDMRLIVQRKPERLHNLLKSSLLRNEHLGNALRHLSDPELDAIIGSALRLEVKGGTDVVRQGDTKPDSFYMVEEGVVEVIKDGHVCKQAGPGYSFGALGLLFWAPRFATWRAVTDTILWVVKRRDLRKVTQLPLRQKLLEYSKVLSQAKTSHGKWLMDSFGKTHQLADALVEATFSRDDYIIRQGEHGESFFILYEGSVVVEVDGREVNLLNADPSQGRAEYFGEAALLFGKPRRASIRVGSERAKVLVLNRLAFLEITAKAPLAPTTDAETHTSKYRLEEFEEVGLLGSGSYGRVTLVKHRSTGQTFALKAISKGKICQRPRGCEQVQTERLVLKSCRSPFVVGLVATFSTTTHIQFLLEACLGGDLRTVCEKQKLFFSTRYACFYTASMLLALEHLHERLIIYRDLKLENVLIDDAGYAKLADFGLSKFVVGHTFTLCGTPALMAPEIVSGEGHNRAVDWWSLGVALYILMTGVLPFDGRTPAETFSKVKLGFEPVFERTGKCPRESNWVNLVSGLSQLNPSERLPVRSGGVKSVKDHPLFMDFDWASFTNQTMYPPYVPHVKNSEDISNFEACEEDAPRDLIYYDPNNGWDNDFIENWPDDP